MVSPIKLWKTERLANQIQEYIKETSMRNWTTTIPGIITALLSIALLWAPAQYHTQLAQTLTIISGLFTGLGLIAAKSSSNHSTVDEIEEATKKAQQKQLSQL